MSENVPKLTAQADGTYRFVVAGVSTAPDGLESTSESPEESTPSPRSSSSDDPRDETPMPELKPIGDYDDILMRAGEFGWWQRRLFMLLWLPSAAAAMAVFMYEFLAYTPKLYEDEDGLHDYAQCMTYK